MSDQVADVLDDAADWLETHRWIQDDLVIEHDKKVIGACSLGVLTQSVHPVSQRLTARDALARHLGIDTRGDNGWLARWNDAQGRTKQQVLDAFRAAAKQERMRPETPAPPGTPDPRGVGTELADDAPNSG
jgi:hypothetical protein